MVQRIWPLLTAAALGLVPFTIMSNFLPAIAEDAGTGVDLLGSFRGLGGVAALIVGVLAAPLLDRLSRTAVATIALVVLGIGSCCALLGNPAAWVVFCLLIGAGTSVLNPAVAALSADRFDSPEDAARAATLVTSTSTITAVLAAPLLALPAVLWGWRVDMLGVLLALLVVAALISRLPSDRQGHTALGYVDAFRAATRLPGAIDLLMVSLLRTTAFMGSLAYISAAFDDRFGMSTGWFSLVWSTSGLAFFLGNFGGGKYLHSRGTAAVMPMLLGATVIGAAAMVILYTAPTLWLAWPMVAVVSAAHAVIAAGVTTAVVRVAGESRGTVLGLNGAAQALGTFLGAALAGAALALGGWPAVALTLGAITVAALAFVRRASVRPAF